MALVVLFYLASFGVSLVFNTGGSARPGATPIVVVAAILGIAAYWALIRLQPLTRRRAVVLALFWAALIAGVTLVFTVGNGTTAVVFGAWYEYLLYVGIVGAAYFATD